MSKLWGALPLLLVSVNSRANMGCMRRGFFEFYQTCDALRASLFDLLVVFGVFTLSFLMFKLYIKWAKEPTAGVSSQNHYEEYVSPLDRLINLRGATGGLHKRIDENREIMNLIYTEAPQLVSKNPWLVGWLNANDEFFTQLAAIAPPKEKTRSSMYPNRPEPIKA